MMTMSCSAGSSSAQKLELVEPMLAVDALEHESGAIARAESLAVGLDQPERVLALDAAEEVEHEEEEEPLGQSELLARDVRRGRHADRHGHHRDPLLGHRGDQRPHVLAPHPHLVDDAERRAQVLRQRARLPPPVADRVASVEEFWPCVVRELLDAVDVHADDVRGVGVPAAVIVVFVAVPGRRPRVRARDVRDVGRLEAFYQQTRGLPDTELRTEVTGDVDPLAKHLAARRGNPRLARRQRLGRDAQLAAAIAVGPFDKRAGR